MFKKYTRKSVSTIIYIVFAYFGQFFTISNKSYNLMCVYNINVICTILKYLEIIIGIALLLLILLKKFAKYNKYLLISAIIVYFCVPIASNSMISLNFRGVLFLIYSVLFYIYYISDTFIHFSTQEIVETGIFVAIALLLNISIFKIRIGENGGSISFAMIPLVVLALKNNFRKSFLSIGLIYGLLNCIFDGYGFVSFPFDYLLAYGSLAIISLYRNKILSKNNKSYGYLVIAIILTCFTKLILHTISGVVFYELTFLGSLIYNAIYVLPSMGITLVALCILINPIKKIYIH